MTADLPIEATIDAQHATFRVTPPHGRPVTFEVALRRVDVTRSHSGYYAAAGDRVPEHVVPELWVDDAENFGGAS